MTKRLVNQPTERGGYIGDTFYGDPDNSTSPTHVWRCGPTGSPEELSPSWFLLDPERDTTELTYYDDGKDARYFLGIDNHTFVKELTEIGMDLTDFDISAIESYMPIVAVISSAGERLGRDTFDAYQDRTYRWCVAVFGDDVAEDKMERAHRFGEEAIEMLQACDVPEEHVIELVRYVYGRPKGTPRQETGGVMNTLAILCTAYDYRMGDAALAEMVRVETPEMMEKVRRKWLTKPKVGGPLPGA